MTERDRLREIIARQLCGPIWDQAVEIWRDMMRMEADGVLAAIEREGFMISPPDDGR
jgi:hypothetical protein